MRYYITAALLLNASMVCAQQPQKPQPIQAAASTFASTEVHINSRLAEGQWYAEDAALTGPSRISITYGQPHARGRKIEGGLMRADTIWRFGANAATTLHTDVDLMIGDVRVERGDYSLYVRYSPNGSVLVINGRTGQWGTDYDRTRDVGRVPLTARPMSDNEESLSIYLVPESASPARGFAEVRGLLRIRWGRTELSAPWRMIT